MQKTIHIQNRTDDLEDQLNILTKNTKQTIDIASNIQTQIDGLKATQTEHSSSSISW